MSSSIVLAVTPLTDVSLWARSKLPLVVALVVGAVLLTRFATWASQRFLQHIDSRAAGTDSLVARRP